MSSSIMFLSDERPTLETLDFGTLYIGSTPTFLYFDLYLNTAYAAHTITAYAAHYYRQQLSHLRPLQRKAY